MKMTNNLKAKILSNKFVDRVRLDGVIDAREYEALCEALVTLAEEWRNLDCIDKELAQDLSQLAPVLRYAAENETNYGKAELGTRLSEMAAVIDDLVMKCFAT
jgi:hypothetical protein